MKDHVTTVSADWPITAKGPLYDLTVLTELAAGELAEHADTTTGGAGIAEPVWSIRDGYLHGDMPTVPDDIDGPPWASQRGMAEDLIDVPLSVYLAVYGPPPVVRKRGPYRQRTEPVAALSAVTPIDLNEVAA